MVSSKYGFTVDYFYQTTDLDEVLTVPELEELIEPSIGQAVDVAVGAIAKANIKRDDLSGILLAGGTSQIPLVTDILWQRFGCQPRIASKELMWLIAKGAAIHHRDLMTRPSQATKLILGMSLYLETFTQGRLADVLLVPSHQTLPHSFVNEFPVNPHHNSVTIQLRTEAGTLDQELLPLGRRVINVKGLGLNKISVKVTIDRNKTIKVSVVNPKTGLPLDKVEIKGDILSTSDEIKAARNEFGFNDIIPSTIAGNQRYAVGIDLGTTTCEVILWDLDESTFSRGIAEPQLSQILVRANGVISVDNGDYSSVMEGYFSNFKVDIGIEADNARYKAHGKYWPPEILSAHLLATIWKQLQEGYGAKSPLTEAVITVPSDFSEDQTALVQNAAKIAGIENPILLTEPVAAFLAYADTYPTIKKSGQKFMIFDFGGGTTDVAIVETKPGERIDTLASYGNNTIGGKDLTNQIAIQIVNRFVERNNLNINQPEYERLRKRLFKKADTAKIELGLALLTGEA